ncbi:MAG: hypothetical protein ACYTEQ_20500 [Planctomycetota bacterium]|jgi:hypothetical protein
MKPRLHTPEQIIKKLREANAGIAALDGSTGFASYCSWVVTSSVGHCGHTHQRQDAYEAAFGLSLLKAPGRYRFRVAKQPAPLDNRRTV